MEQDSLTPFHLAVPVHDLAQGRAFYGDLLGFEEGRSSVQWVDYNMYGHQFVIHLNEALDPKPHHNAVDGHAVPVPHFGVVLEWQAWHQLKEKLESSGLEFVIAPHIRFEGEAGEQATMFFQDPSGNALEFKSFKDFSNIFAK